MFITLYRIYYSFSIKINLPRTTPIERRMIKGLLLPKLDLHRSERDPMIGVRKNPINGDKHHMRVMCL